MEAKISSTSQAEIIQLHGVLDLILPQFMSGFVISSPDQCEQYKIMI